MAFTLDWPDDPVKGDQYPFTGPRRWFWNGQAWQKVPTQALSVFTLVSGVVDVTAELPSPVNGSRDSPVWSLVNYV